MAFALLKLSYNDPGDSNVVGGICGTGFFIDTSTAITAHHVLNEVTFAPNNGFKNAIVWVVSRSGHVHKIDESFVDFYPDIDSSIIYFKKSISGYVVYDVAPENISKGVTVSGLGYIGNGMPRLDLNWQNQKLVINSIDLTNKVIDRDGFIEETARYSINAIDIKMKDIHGFKLSFGSRIGMSGGPVINNKNNREDFIRGMDSLVEEVKLRPYEVFRFGLQGNNTVGLLLNYFNTPERLQEVKLSSLAKDWKNINFGRIEDIIKCPVNLQMFKIYNLTQPARKKEDLKILFNKTWDDFLNLK